MKISGIIYKLRNKVNGKVYIGQTITTLEVRVGQHLRCKDSFPIVNALRKYGLQSFMTSVIDMASSKAVLDEKERYWIARCKSLVSQGGYNVTAGGGGCVGVKRPRHVCDAVGAANKLRPAPMTGRKHTKEARKKMSIAQKGIKLSPEWRRKIGVSGLGRIVSIETRNKIGDGNRGRKRPDLAEMNRRRAIAF